MRFEYADICTDVYLFTCLVVGHLANAKRSTAFLISPVFMPLEQILSDRFHSGLCKYPGSCC